MILVLVPVYFFTTVLPVTYKARHAEIAKLEARHQELGRDLEKARLLVRNLARVEKEYQILHEQWTVAQMLLPQKNEMPALLRKVTAAGSQSGVEFQLFKPGAAGGPGILRREPGRSEGAGGLSPVRHLPEPAGEPQSHRQRRQSETQGDRQAGRTSRTSVEASMTISAYTLEGAAVAEPDDQGDGNKKADADERIRRGQDARPRTGGEGQPKTTVTRARDAAAKASAGAGAGGR